MKNFALQAQADALMPWRYSYEHEGVKIEGDPVAAPIHGQYGRGRETMQHILASTESTPGLLDVLNRGHEVPGLRFYDWNGDRLDGFSLRRGWRTFVSRLALRVAYGIGERLGGSAMRQTRRADIASKFQR